MKRLLVLLLLTIFIVTTPSGVFAQGMMGSPPAGGSPQVGIQSGISSDAHTAREEQEGEELWKNLQDKQITCDKLSDDNFGALGEYFMGQMVGDSHEAMNTMMERMMGKEGEEQMHVVMGKRLSGCQTDAQIPQGGFGFMPMMWMMGGGGNPMMGNGGWNNMMGGWNGFGILGWLPMLLFWILLILGVVALFRYLGGSGKKAMRINHHWIFSRNVTLAERLIEKSLRR